MDITFDGFPNLLLWRGGAGKFICIEPWTNLPDVVGKENIEFSLPLLAFSELQLYRTIVRLRIKVLKIYLSFSLSVSVSIGLSTR